MMNVLRLTVCSGLLLANLSGFYFYYNTSSADPFAGTVDLFDPVPNSIVYDIAMQPDGKVLIGGTFTSVGGATRNGIARINSDGTLDTSFDASSAIFPPSSTWSLGVQSIEPLPNGQILVGGLFFDSTGSNLGVVRLNSDGSRDATFNANFLSGLAYDILPLPDGRIVVAGSVFLIGSPQSPVQRYGIVVFNSDGSLNSASPDFGAGRFVYALARQTDGKIVIGGEEPLVTSSRLHRLNTDFSLDTSFDPGCNGPIEAVKIQPDGKILVGGSFTTIGGGGTGTTNRSGIARLNSDGTLNTTFVGGSNGTVFSIETGSDDTILIGGAFSLVAGGGSGTPRKNIARLWSDGSVEPNFDPEVLNGEFQGIVFAIAMQSDLKPLVGGSFSTLGGVLRSFVGRFEYLDPNSTPSPTPTPTATPTPTPTPIPTPTPQRLGNVGGTVKYAFKRRKGIAGMLMTVVGPGVSATTYTDAHGSFAVMNLPPGDYTVTAFSNDYVFVANPQIATIKQNGSGGFVQFIAYYPRF